MARSRLARFKASFPQEAAWSILKSIVGLCVVIWMSTIAAVGFLGMEPVHSVEMEWGWLIGGVALLPAIVCLFRLACGDDDGKHPWR